MNLKQAGRKRMLEIVYWHKWFQKMLPV